MRLTEFGLGNEDGQMLHNAFAMTDEIVVLLQQNGIDPKIVNKLLLPAGLGRVGTFTILTHLPEQELGLGGDPFYAIVGAMKWPLSRNYRIQRIFPVRNAPKDTLAVVSFDDFRLDLQQNRTGTTIPKSQTNAYQDDWTVENFGTPATEEDGENPVDVAMLDSQGFRLLVPTAAELPTLYDPLNAWGYDTGYSDGELADNVLAASGAVAVPYMQLRPNAETIYHFTDRGELVEDQCFIAPYIGNGWQNAIEMWGIHSKFYWAGQLQCAFGTEQDLSGTIGGTDSMLPGTNANFPDTPAEADAPAWTGNAPDGSTNVPRWINIQFPTRDKTTGKIILYRFEFVDHGRPDGFGDLTDEQEITDHIKTVVMVTESDIPNFNTDGVKDLVVYPGIDPFDAPGVDVMRMQIIVDRALQLSRQYYARYRACTGDWTLNGFHLMRPWAGMLQLEYGFRGNLPYTRVHGDINDERLGFHKTDFAKKSMVSSGGLMMTRPDSLVDIAVEGGGGVTGIAAEVDAVTLDAGGCLAAYDIKRLSDGVVFTDLTPWREVPNMCYMPAEVGTICMLSTHPTFDQDDPDFSHLYFLIVDEQVQTRECAQ